MAEPPSPSHLPSILWGVACFSIIAAVIGGLVVTGGPQQQRAQRMDEQRVQDLGNLRQDISHYDAIHHQLPATLEELKQVDYSASRKTHDPVSKQPYEYRPLSENQFELCAVFETEAKPNEPPYTDNMTEHPRGRYCYRFQRLPKQTGRTTPEVDMNATRFQRISGS